MRPLPDHLFVYGTLRRGAQSPLQARVAAETTVVSSGTIGGQLYRMRHFPALVLEAPDSAHRVHGELLHLPDDKVRRRRLLSELDHYEGVLHGPAEPLSLFLRQITDVTRSDGVHTPAWVYVYHRDVSGATRIPHGDWMHEASP